MSDAAILDTSFKKQPVNFTASKARRLLNMLIDTFVNLPVGFYLYFQFVEIDWNTGQQSGNALLGNLALYGFFFVYYFFTEAFFGRTIGKLITGTKVVDAHGEEAGLGAIAIRTLVRFIPIDPFSFFGPKGIGWHDSVAKTYVVGKDFFREE